MCITPRKKYDGSFKINASETHWTVRVAMISHNFTWIALQLLQDFAYKILSNCAETGHECQTTKRSMTGKKGLLCAQLADKENAAVECIPYCR